MADGLTSVHDLFAAPEFDKQFTTWQQARTATGEATGKLIHNLETQLEGEPGMDAHDIDLEVSLCLEADPKAVVVEDLCLEAHTGDLIRQRAAVFAQEREEKKALLDISDRLGVSKFALYGLWLHMRDPSSITAQWLEDRVAAAERDMRVVDELVRTNAGRILTVVDMGVTAIRLGEGGIRIVDNNRVLVPRAEGSLKHYALLDDNEPTVHSSDRPLYVEAGKIHSILDVDGRDAQTTEDWADLLNTDSLRYKGRYPLFVVGEVAEGPPYAGEQEDAAFWKMVFYTVRATSMAAAQEHESQHE